MLCIHVWLSAARRRAKIYAFNLAGIMYVLWADPEFLITVLYSRSYVICFIYQAYLGSMNMGIEFTTAIFMVTFLVIWILSFFVFSSMLLKYFCS